MDKKIQPSQLRVGRYDSRKQRQPITCGFTNELIHVKEELSPFQLKDEKGRIVENVWQFQKWFPFVKEQKQTRIYSWSHPFEIHQNPETKEPTDDYLRWRQKGLNFRTAVRWPNGPGGAKECICHLVEDQDESKLYPIFSITTPTKFKKLDYIAARKEVYFQVYVTAARKTKSFRDYKRRLLEGENIQINEVDGPSAGTPGTPFQLVKDDSIPVTQQIVLDWVNNTKQPFGHGICLAVALLDWDHLLLKC